MSKDVIFYEMSSWYAFSGDALKDDDDHNSYVQTEKKESENLSGPETPSSSTPTVSIQHPSSIVSSMPLKLLTQEHTAAD